MTTADEPPHPLLVLARKQLRRWDLEFVSTGQQQWIETTAAKKKLWLILQTGDEVNFELLD